MLAVLVLLLEVYCPPPIYMGVLPLLLKLTGPDPKFDEFLIEFLSPNWGLELGVTPGGYISPVYVIVN